MDIGVVVPSLRPEPKLVAGYIDAIERSLDPATITIELDRPEGSGNRRLMRALRRRGCRVNVAERRRGKGAAVTSGLDGLDTDVALVVDDDASVPAPSLARLVDAVRDGTALAVGSRRHPDATDVEHGSVLRRVLGDAFAGLARRVMSPTLYDYQCGAKALDLRAWRDVSDDVRERGFAWDLEVIGLMFRNGEEVVEVPVTWTDSSRSRVPIAPTVIELARGLYRHGAPIPGVDVDDLVEPQRQR